MRRRNFVKERTDRESEEYQEKLKRRLSMAKARAKRKSRGHIRRNESTDQ